MSVFFSSNKCKVSLESSVKKWSLLEMNEEYDISRGNMATLFVSTKGLPEVIDLPKSIRLNNSY